MDILGILILVGTTPNVSPILWPPVQHIEGWAANMQYSSLTTQLFWVYNQAVPAWLCTAMLINSQTNRQNFLIWSLCYFLAPLPALGLVIPVALTILQTPVSNLFAQLKEKRPFNSMIGDLYKNLLSTCSPENVVGGGIILMISFLYFSTNSYSGSFNLFNLDQIKFSNYVNFVLVEGGLLWLILLPQHKKQIQWYVIGAMLFLFPWIKVGEGSDFSMRASIPVLFYLMVASGKSLVHNKRRITVAVLICLLIGAVTPINEINRSISLTTSYYKSVYLEPPNSNAITQKQQDDLQLHLTNDSVPSLSIYPSDTPLYFISRPGNSIFYKYIIRDIQPQP
jgi:hypothetical protein